MLSQAAGGLAARARTAHVCEAASRLTTSGVRTPLRRERVSWCEAEGAELRHLPGSGACLWHASTTRHRRRVMLLSCTLSRDMSQPPVTPGRYASVRGPHEACRRSRYLHPSLCDGCSV